MLPARCVFAYDDPYVTCRVCEAEWSVVESRCSIAQRAARDSTSCARSSMPARLRRPAIMREQRSRPVV